MGKYILKKIFVLIVTVVLISIVTFLAFSVIPGDAAISRLGSDATPDKIAKIRSEMGLDKDVVTRYVSWAGNAVKGDFGESLQYRGHKVSQLLMTRLPYTLTIGFLSILLLIFISLPIGIISAKFEGSKIDGLILVLTHIFMAIPGFFMGIILTYIFGVMLKVFTPGKYISPAEDFFESLGYLIFPAIAVALPKVAMTVKYVREAIVLELETDYVRTARAKGCTENQILVGHVLKNAMITVLTFMGLVIAEIMAGSVIVEQVFSVPGIGKFLVNAILKRDYPVVQAVVIYIAIIVVLCNTIVDILYSIADPRIKIEEM